MRRCLFTTSQRCLQSSLNQHYCCSCNLSSFIHLLNLFSSVYNALFKSSFCARCDCFFQYFFFNSKVIFLFFYYWSAMKLICTRCWLRIYCLATVKSRDYQKFEWHWDTAWWWSAVRWSRAKFSRSRRLW